MLASLCSRFVAAASEGSFRHLELGGRVRSLSGARDIARLEGLEGDEGLDFAMYVPPADDAAQRRLKVYRAGPALHHAM